MFHDNTYHDLLLEIYDTGVSKEDRTGTGTFSKFGCRMEFDIRERFPLLTAKKVHWKSVVEELLWFMRGQTNTRDLDATIWDEWAGPDGDCGPIYGYQWRSWPYFQYKTVPTDPLFPVLVEANFDQLKQVVEDLKQNPDSRRHIVSAWNVGCLGDMALPPCHLLFQFYVNNGFLDCQMYQRSCDMFLGVPFNIASYSLLTHIISHMTGLKPGRFIWVGGDCHIYKNHVNQVEEYLQRVPYTSPILELRPDGERTLDNWKFEDFVLTDYQTHGTIKADVAV